MSFNLKTISAIPKVKVIAKIQGQILYWLSICGVTHVWLAVIKYLDGESILNFHYSFNLMFLHMFLCTCSIHKFDKFWNLITQS